MKLNIKKPILRNGKRYNEGEIIDLPDNVAKIWIKKGFANKISKKQNKEEIETKEFKIDNLDTKNDAPIKD